MDGRSLFRPTPALPVTAFQTFTIDRPLETHWRVGTCAEVKCLNLTHGWWTEVDEDSTLGGMQAAYIRRDSGRRFVESKTPEGLTRFEFEAGQECFAEHKVAVERDPLFLVRPGDHRGNPFGTAPRVHKRPEHWVEHFAETLDGVRTVKERG